MYTPLTVPSYPIRPASSPTREVAAVPLAHAEARALPWAALTYTLAVVLVVALAPFEFASPDRFRVYLLEWAPLDLFGNLLLFLPLGFFWRMLHGSEEDQHAGRVVVLGAVLSLTIECAQLFLVERYTTPLDVATNALGAGLGAVLYDRLRTKLDPTTLVGGMALELPLTGLVYLLVPLCWLSALTIGVDAGRPWLLLCLGLFGGSVLGALQRRHLGPAGVFSPIMMGAVAGLGFLVGAVPALGAWPDGVAVVTLGIAAFTWHRAAAPLTGAEDRRFELGALARAAPFFAAYMLLLALTDAGEGVMQRHHVVRMLETMAAFTLLGYMVAEAFSRRELRFRSSAWRVALAALLVAAAAAALRAMNVPPVEEAWRAGAGLLAAEYGALLYHLQRKHVRGVMAAARARQAERAGARAGLRA